MSTTFESTYQPEPEFPMYPSMETLNERFTKFERSQEQKEKNLENKLLKKFEDLSKIKEKSKAENKRKITELEEKSKAENKRKITELEEKSKADNKRITELEEKSKAENKRITELEEKSKAENKRIKDLEEKLQGYDQKFTNWDAKIRQIEEKIYRPTVVNQNWDVQQVEPIKCLAISMASDLSSKKTEFSRALGDFGIIVEEFFDYQKLDMQRLAHHKLVLFFHASSAAKTPPSDEKQQVMSQIIHELPCGSNWLLCFVFKSNSVDGVSSENCRPISLFGRDTVPLVFTFGYESVLDFAENKSSLQSIRNLIE